MLLEKIPVGPLSVNCYVIGDDGTNKVAVVDPGGDADKILRFLDENELELEYIILTHAHGDHIGGIPGLLEKIDVPVYMHKEDLFILKDMEKNYSKQMGLTYELETENFVADGDELSLGDLKLKIIHTPGHTPGGICILVENFLIAGDTLFANSIGRSDLVGGNHNQLIDSIKGKLMVLDEEIMVLPGHGPASRIGIEKLTNPFLK
ncbi:MBL fold metallo-hydrolase [Alkaliphilus hydrothermalis]|uniref:Glyoxylase-like metal-dependent hydrolase (Beta-lactamase superfamily II) n=1 Tax=Alkaliphilus hydrothermalis TaxID=1482730 RepID=A0ABS2NLZ2_9FIRM|nr:MBL fold metallo-hydrolase [Alkaliphilus hydrothermalis]MBM7613896.1 glyoxylase-like metal-dependent hydrolase (beta-lactamase superfamily II) [Alkaliphilus hydrothermalis]